ncbi:hypothetical protein VNO78_31752 [Psophocarpus tetragonolobus]|uniref:Uncharacterized protein n=1 Tax=Psophocarpus tetragonolobus TaxID=3891 RepID=A0AAN9S0R4_PSOTE
MWISGRSLFLGFLTLSFVLESWVVLCIIRNVVYNRQCLFRSLVLCSDTKTILYFCHLSVILTLVISISFSLLQKKIPTLVHIYCSLWQSFDLGWLHCLS